MAQLELKSRRFREEREWDWRKLDALLRRIERKSVRSLSDAEIMRLPVLYRSTLSALSVARATSLDRSLVEYLESLSTRAYFIVYGTRSTLIDRVGGFFARDWPRAVRALWRETLITVLLLGAGAVTAFLMTSHDPDWFSAFVPSALGQGRDPAADTATLRKALYDNDGGSGLSVFATFLFANNAQVALLAFALGFALCLPTAALVTYTGATLGAFVALYASRGLGFELGAWISIHGATELFAVILAGAAGLRIGWSLAFPGDRRRLDALAAAGKTASLTMLGVLVMLFVAALLEGFGRQLITLDLARYAVAGLSLTVWLAYFYAPRRRA